MRYQESNAVRDGLIIDATARFPHVCQAGGLRWRLLVTAECWRLGLTSLPVTGFVLDEKDQLKHVLEQYRSAHQGIHSERQIRFNVDVQHLGRGHLELGLVATVSFWDGVRQHPYILFSLGAPN